MNSADILEESCRKAKEYGAKNLTVGTVQAVHGALCKYLQETFRSKKGAVIRGIARISWVKDPLLGQNPRPSFDLDTALARQGGINQLNPTTTGSGGREQLRVEENPTAKIALQYATGVARDDVATAIKIFAIVIARGASRGAVDFDLGVGKLVIRNRLADLRFSPEFNPYPPRQRRVTFDPKRDLQAKPPRDDSPGTRAAPPAVRPSGRPEAAHHNQALRAAGGTSARGAGGGARGARGQRAAQVVVGSRSATVGDSLDMLVAGQGVGVEGGKDDAGERERDAGPRQAHGERDKGAGGGSMRDALARLTEELGDPFADPRPPKRYGPEADGRVTSLPGLADGEEGEGDVIAFYRKGQRIDVGKARGKKTFGGHTTETEAGRGMRMDQGGSHVQYFNGKVPLVSSKDFQRKVRDFSQSNPAVQDAERRVQEQREAELLQEQRMEEEMERRRLMLNTDAEDILSRRRGENKEVLSQVRGQAQQKKAIIQEEKAADVENARAARFGVSVPAPRDESKDFAERNLKMRQYKEELEEEIRRKHEAQRAQKMEKMMAERAELGDAQDKLVDGVLKTRQEEREKKELEEAYLAAQSLARKKSGAKAVAV